MVIVSADATAAHQSVINVMDAARRAGLPRLTFADPDAARRRRAERGATARSRSAAALQRAWLAAAPLARRCWPLSLAVRRRSRRCAARLYRLRHALRRAARCRCR